MYATCKEFAYIHLTTLLFHVLGVSFTFVFKKQIFKFTQPSTKKTQITWISQTCYMDITDMLRRITFHVTYVIKNVINFQLFHQIKRGN